MSTSACETYMRPVLVGVIVDQPENVLFQPRCKLWTCPYCARLNAMLWRARIEQGVEHYQQAGMKAWSFVTITMSRKVRGFAASVAMWPKCWAKLSTRIRRLVPGVRYVLLPEKHKDGTLHTHALMSGEIGNTWIVKNAHSCGLGYKSQSKAMTDLSKVSGYVLKYITKSTGVDDWPPRFRRIRTSQKWPALIDDDNYISIDAEWRYLASYPSDGLEYLAEGLTAKTGINHKII